LTDDSGDSRRRFLKRATLGLSGVVTVVVAAPIARTLGFPVSGRVVSIGSEPIDCLSEKDLAPGGPPVRIELLAQTSRDAWSAQSGTPLGAAYIYKTKEGKVIALSSICPHLGCAIGHDSAAGRFQCPCHKSAFALSGERIEGPSKRGLDPLPVIVENGRVKVRFVRYRPDVAERVEV
jgi:Rieske Fe-S protein